jgi:hypothetical protein
MSPQNNITANDTNLPHLKNPFLAASTQHLKGTFLRLYRSADKSVARPGRKQVTATEDFEFHISYL